VVRAWLTTLFVGGLGSSGSRGETLGHWQANNKKVSLPFLKRYHYRLQIGSVTCFAPGSARTCNPMIRSHILYPIELRVRGMREIRMARKRGMATAIAAGDRRLGFGVRSSVLAVRAVPPLTRCILVSSLCLLCLCCEIPRSRFTAGAGSGV
jgi:hypothetical protein